MIYIYGIYFFMFSFLFCIYVIIVLPPRAPEAQRPPPKAAGEIVRPNHYDPDEDADYYRKQLSLLDKLHTGPNKPQLQAQTSQSFPR